MTYSAEISRANPACLLLLIDQSGSMADGWAGDANRKKADTLADVVNKLLQNLVIRNTTGDDVKDRFHVGVVGYGQAVTPAFSTLSGGSDLVPLNLIARNPARLEERSKRVDDGAGGVMEQTVKFPVWFDAVANGGTPMCQAFTLAQKIVADFVNAHPNCFPPIVVNITDGESTDGDPSSVAETIRAISSSDGNTLVMNVHISSRAGGEILYADDENALPDQYAKLLFQMSSVMPPKMLEEAKKLNYKVSEKSRGFTFNTSIVSLIDFLDIGTRPSNMR